MTRDKFKTTYDKKLPFKRVHDGKLFTVVKVVPTGNTIFLVHFKKHKNNNSNTRIRVLDLISFCKEFE